MDHRVESGSCNFQALSNFGGRVPAARRRRAKWLHLSKVQDEIFTSRHLPSKPLTTPAPPQGITSLTLRIKHIKGAAAYQTFPIVAGAARAKERRVVLCGSLCLGNDKEQLRVPLSSLPRKVTLIKPRLMMALIKSAILFPSLRLCLYGGDSSRGFVL